MARSFPNGKLSVFIPTPRAVAWYASDMTTQINIDLTALIVYSSCDEVLVCTLDSEPRLLTLWFEEGGRNLEDFDREVQSEGIVEITSRLNLSF